MGSKNSIHVRMLETVPAVGGVIAITHIVRKNNK